MSSGFFLINRGLVSSDLWLSEEFTRGQAWIDLIGLANYKAGIIRKRGVRIELKRGHVGWSQMALSERWQWSRGKVIRYLDELERDGRIVQQKNNVTTLIYIVNYESYQNCGTTDSTTDSTTDGTGRKKVKKENKEHKGKDAEYDLPQWLDVQAWDEFVQHRKDIKKPITKLSASKALKILSESRSHQQEIIDKTIGNVWVGLFPLKGKQSHQPKDDPELAGAI